MRGSCVVPFVGPPRSVRLVVLALLLAVLAPVTGCTVTASDGGEFDPIGPGQGNGCRSDSSCGGGDVCARNGECMPASKVRSVHVTWTLSGKPADEASCSAQPELQIKILATNNGDRVDYSPVPCVAGKFSVDVLPTSFDRAELGPERGRDGWRSGMLDAEGNATLDLPF
jgi:hypothetical protein